MSIRDRIVAAMMVAFIGVPMLMLYAQQNENKQDASLQEKSKAPDDANNDPELSQKQKILSGKYQRFEKTMRQVMEYLRKNEPEKADLLIRAINRSSEERIRAQMEQISAMLDREQFGDARERQTEVVTHLRALLYLLQSESRLDRLRAEQKRIEELIKDVTRIIGKEKDARAANERGENKESAKRKQKNVADDTKQLTKKIDRQDAAKRGEPGSQNGKQGKSGEGKSDRGKSDKDKSGQDKSGKDKADKNKSDKGKSGEGKSGQGKSGKGQPKKGKKSGNPRKEENNKKGDPQSENDPQQSDQVGPIRTPGREEIEQALREMNRAIEKLEKENREGASSDQDKAIQELRKAKEKLEEILRQLREEEREILLAALEARFQKMLQLQILVYNGTRALAKTPNSDWESRQFGRSRELSQRENDIALDAAKALDILKEEGSSVAFPESIAQLREDMLLVARRLEQYHVGDFTQAVEMEIIEALEEMIDALQKELEKIKENKKEPQEGQPSDPPLVDNLAELKMLRSLQYRVNRRTRQLGRLILGEQATENEAEVLKQLQALADRQERIQKATYDIATGRNQ